MSFLLFFTDEGISFLTFTIDKYLIDGEKNKTSSNFLRIGVCVCL